MTKTVLGISAYYHDSAAALVLDGVIIAAAQEERFTRKKADASFPENSIKSKRARRRRPTPPWSGRNPRHAARTPLRRRCR